MFPTFISIIDIQSWWEVPSIAHFCSLFRTAFNLLDFDIEDLEEALLTDGTEESSWLQDLIVRLLSGCVPNNEISTFNYQMFLRRLFRQKCQEHDRYNPFNTDIDFQLLPLRTKVDILHALCDFRLDADDVFDQLKNLEADSLRVEPLGYDSNESAYWYFYGTRLYREDGQTKSNKKSVWQVICFTEDDWYQLTKKFKKSANKQEKQLYQTLNENFLPELPRLFKEKENLARKRLLENLPRRTSTRLRKLEYDAEKVLIEKAQKVAQEEVNQQEQTEENKKKELERRRKEAYERRAKLKEQSEEGSLSDCSVDRDEMAGYKSRKSKGRQRKVSSSSSTSKDNVSKRPKKSKKQQKELETISKSSVSTTTVGRQTNNSLSAATGQILIQQAPNTNKKKIKTSLVFRQTDEDLQTGMHKILDYMKNHEDAWPFVDPVEEEYAPNYYSIIRKPMDLQRMEERLDSGYYKTFGKFRSDFQLIVDNCRLYNGVENEYTEMVDNLLKAFERATEKYLDMISSSDDEIAIEYSNAESGKNIKKAKNDESSKTQLNSRRKPMLVAQTDKKRERSVSETSENSRKSGDLSDVSTVQTKNEKVVKKTKKALKAKNVKLTKKQKSNVKTDKVLKEKKKDEHEIKKSKKEKSANKKAAHLSKNKTKKSVKKEKKNSVVRSRSNSQSLYESPIRSERSNSSFSCPPSSPEDKFFSTSQENSRKRPFQNLNDSEDSCKGKASKLSKFGSDSDDLIFTSEEKTTDYPISLSPKPKDKHNKLRETIEKLKAKSEIKLRDEFDFEIDLPKENKDKNRKQENELENKNSLKVKEKSHFNQITKSDVNFEVDSNNTTDSTDSKNAKKITSKNNILPPKSSNLDALTIATEETLKDINKWLDDTPKFSEFSSTSNSPSYTGGEDLDVIPGKIDQTAVKKNDKPPTSTKKEAGAKDHNKKRRDTAKFFKKREVQRTIDRLQPGKSKGNLISNVQNSNKADEMFALGPLTKIKDTKNSLIVKTDTNAPKLSLGSVLDSFGKHNFVDDQKKEEQKILAEIPKENASLNFIDSAKQEIVVDPIVNKEDKEDHKETESIMDDNTISAGGATPNLSAWFKAFGAPKVQTIQKKNDIKPDGKENEKIDESSNKNSKVSPPVGSSNVDTLGMPHGQLIPRQRRVSTGSSMSERSSFSQDMDSPRVGMDERGAYPAPYPSPLHRSPSGASPVMASPRPDISPKAAAYPTISGQMRCGFYQDTVSNKSSPDKSCSPKETPQSPYPHYSEHVYTPNTENSYYSYANSPYYTHAPNYSSTNPTPPYSMEGSSSYYDTTKPLNEQHQTKNTPNYTANSPASNHSSPAHPQHSPSLVLSPHSPNVLSPHSPNVLSPHSPNVLSPHSPNVLSPHSPNVLSPHSPSIHSPSVHPAHASNIHSPSIHSQQSPNISQHPTGVPQHPTGVPQHLTGVPQHLTGVPQHASNIQFQNSPNFHPQQSPQSESSADFQSRRSPGLPVPHSPAKSLNALSNDLSNSTLQNEFSSLHNSVNLRIQNPNNNNNNNNIVRSSPPSPKLQTNLPEPEPYQKNDQNEISDNRIFQQSGQQSSAMFPVKKRIYTNDTESVHQIDTQEYEATHNPTAPSVSESSKNLPDILERENYKTTHHQDQHALLDIRESLHSRSVSSPLPQTTADIMNNILGTKFPSSFSVPYNREHLKIPTTTIPSTQANAMEMSKYTNMGYTGPPEIGYAKSGIQQQQQQQQSSSSSSINSSSLPPGGAFKSSSSIQVTSSATQSLSQPMDISRLCTSPSRRFKVLEEGNTITGQVTKQQSLNTNFTSSTSSRSTDLTNHQCISSGYVADVPTPPRPTYNSQAIDVDQPPPPPPPIGLGRNISSSFSHLVDHYGSEERLLAGLQSSSSFYTDKGLGTSQLFNKAVVGANTPNLPMFSQADMAAMQQCYNQSIQGTRALYNRPMAGIQNSSAIQSDQKTTATSLQQSQVQEKKKKRKSSKVVPASEAQSSIPHQGFQSYAGLKGNASVEPSAISLKTSSVVPGSAFNFGPTPTSLGINPSLYSDKDAYPNFLDEFRSAPNYYMAAAAHHRSKTESSSEKQTRSAHQNANPQAAPGYSFLGSTPPTRPTYPIGGPFITNAAQAAQLMDTSSPLYQHYLQAGVLNQGLLGPPGAYPPGYHPALSIRQPYDAMTRPPWL